MEDGGWRMDDFFSAKSAKIFFMLMMLMSARALRSAKGCCVFFVAGTRLLPC